MQESMVDQEPVQADPRSRTGGISRAETLLAHRRSVERAISVMSERLDEDISLSDMAAMGFMSPFHFNRVFHDVTGLPPCQFLSALRIQMAKRILLTTNESVTEICFAVGYNSLGTFTRRFNELVGLPPSRFRTFGRSTLEKVLSMAHRMPLPLAEPATAGPGIAGRVGTMPSHHSIVLIGLFAEALAQGSPLACTIALAPGGYNLPLLPDGRYELLAVSLPAPDDLCENLLYDEVSRARMPVTIEHGQVIGPTDLLLHPPRSIDPPILVALPWLLAQRMARLSESGEAPGRLWDESGR
jgi:AraC family transcriptional regulator